MTGIARRAGHISRVCLASSVIVFASDVAIARPDATKMSCAAARELVFQQGAVVMTTGKYTFARFVESQFHCQPVDEISRPAFVKTRDNPECWIGYTCENRSDFFSGN